MRGMRHGLGIVLTTLTLSACGTAAAGVPGTAPPVATTPVTATNEAPDSPGPTFPMTLRRSGGIAGFDDTVVLETNGVIRVETRSIHGRVCRLGRSQQAQLFAVLATLRRDTTPTVGVDHPDVIRISLTDAHDRPFDLTDPSLGSVSDLVGALVSDVTLRTPATVSCKAAG